RVHVAHAVHAHLFANGRHDVRFVPSGIGRPGNGRQMAFSDEIPEPQMARRHDDVAFPPSFERVHHRSVIGFERNDVEPDACVPGPLVSVDDAQLPVNVGINGRIPYGHDRDRLASHGFASLLAEGYSVRMSGPWSTMPTTSASIGAGWSRAACTAEPKATSTSWPMPAPIRSAATNRSFRPSSMLWTT